MARHFKTALDLNRNELRGVVLQNLSEPPASPVKGQKYFHSSENCEYYYNGSSWVKVAPYSLTINNNGDNRVLTSNNTVSSLEAEANLTFDGTTLSVGSLVKIGDGKIGINIGGSNPAYHLDMVGDIWQSGASSISLSSDRTSTNRKWKIARGYDTHRFSIFHCNTVPEQNEVFGIDYTTKAIRFNDAYSFPTSIGSAGQTLRVPSSGSTLEWNTPSGGITDDWSDPASDHSYKGFKRSMLCGGVTMNFGDVGYIATNGKIELADADSIASTGSLVMALATVTSNNPADFLILGVVRDDTWNWTIGSPIYLSTSGTTGNILTQTLPSGTEDVVQIVGFALSADVMMFNPNLARVVIR